MRNTVVWENSFFENRYKTCSFVENQCYVYKSHTISFYYIYNKYDKSKLETEEHVDDYFTCTYKYTAIHK